MDHKVVFAQKEFSVVHSITNAPIPAHAHSEYMISYYLHGQAFCRIGSKPRMQFRSGDIGLLNPGEAHEDFVSNGQRDYLTVGIKRELLRGLLAEAGRVSDSDLYIPSPKAQATAPLEKLFRVLCEEVEGQGFGRPIALRYLVLEVAIHILRGLTPYAWPVPRLDFDRPVAHWRIQRALEYLRDTYTEEFSLRRLSDATGLSKWHLERAFKRATGFSPHEYMVFLRIEKAKELLASSPDPISEIALELGFSHQSHFTNAFKRYVGITPGAFRLSTR